MNDNKERALEEGVYFQRAQVYISIDRVKKLCYASDYTGEVIDDSSRGLLVELDREIGEEIQIELSISLEEYGVRLLYEEPLIFKEEIL